MGDFPSLKTMSISVNPLKDVLKATNNEVYECGCEAPIRQVGEVAR
jgi:hypothetical protein